MRHIAAEGARTTSRPEMASGVFLGARPAWDSANVSFRLLASATKHFTRSPLAPAQKMLSFSDGDDHCRRRLRLLLLGAILLVSCTRSMWSSTGTRRRQPFPLMSWEIPLYSNSVPRDTREFCAQHVPPAMPAGVTTSVASASLPVCLQQRSLGSSSSYSS